MSTAGTPFASPSLEGSPAPGTLDRLASAISVVSSPFLVLPVACLLLVGRLTTDFEDFYAWTLVCVLLSSAVPAIYILALWRSGRITDVHVGLREQRRGPFVASMLSFVALTLLLLTSGAPRPVVALAAVLLGNSVTFGLLSNRWKVSLHSGVLASALTAAILVLGWSAAWLVLVVPVIWSRQRRGCHTLAQGLVGAAMGVAVTALVLVAA